MPTFRCERRGTLERRCSSEYLGISECRLRPGRRVGYKSSFNLMPKRLCHRMSLVPVVGVEPTHGCPWQILSLLRLPIPPHRRGMCARAGVRPGRGGGSIGRSANSRKRRMQRAEVRWGTLLAIAARRIRSEARMDFGLNEEQLMIQAAAREFAQEQVAPVAAKLDASGEFPFETIRKAGELGFMGVETPTEYGGAGLDPMSYVLVMEEIAAADAAHSTIVSVNNSLYVRAFSSTAPKSSGRSSSRPIASGKAIGCYGLTEPQSGSDAAAMRTKATLSADGSHYVINGKKSWITSGPVADLHDVVCNDGPEKNPAASPPSSSIAISRVSFAARPSPSSAFAPRRPARLSSSTTNVRSKIASVRKARASALRCRFSIRVASASPRSLSALREPPMKPRFLRERAPRIWRADRQLSDDSTEDRRYEDASSMRRTC